MGIFLLNILLALAWMALTGQFTPVNFLGGFVVSYLILRAMQLRTGLPPYFRKVRQALEFLWFFVTQLIKANLRIAYEVLTLPHTMRPGVVAVPLDLKTDAEITLLVNLLTLTPGSLSLDVSVDRRVLYVHEMYIRDPEQVRREIKDGFERRVMEVLR
jgi:multicomponent Na+:H+ antiporter subunit E